MDGLDLAKEVSCSKKYLYNTNKKFKFNVAVIDFGIKKNILRILSDIGCKLSVFPADVTKEEIISKLGKEKFETEEDIFKFIDLDYVVPENRNTTTLSKIL